MYPEDDLMKQVFEHCYTWKMNFLVVVVVVVVVRHEEYSDKRQMN